MKNDHESAPEVPDSTRSEDQAVERRQRDALGRLSEIVFATEERFREEHRVLSFQEYVALFATSPARYGRSAADYVRDVFDHYGTDPVERPWGKLTRFRLFDTPWERAAGSEPALVGHERLQEEIYRALCNFAREGRANRLILMHGPNGSAKTTVASCILRGLEHYSTLDQGALYRFHWIFPQRLKGKSAIGFGGSSPGGEPDSYAHLEEEAIDARLVIELRDPPLFLLPIAERRELVDLLWERAGEPGSPPEWLLRGQLSHKNQMIFEALLATYEGSLHDVLRHVQVERYYISRRYRVGAVTLGPEMSVDAHERQLTADRSVSALPTFLQATTLFEAYGELVEAYGGVLEYSDLLKRPIDAFRYLQNALETGQVALGSQTIFTNVVMVGSANDLHLAAFREHPEYPSFRGRLHLARVPYLRSYLDEEQIYEQQIVPQLTRHVAPHAIRTAAEFAVLTRTLRPVAKSFPEQLQEIVEGLTVVEKMVLVSKGVSPRRLSADQRKLLEANVATVYRETESAVDYEGRVGASPREVRTLLLDAAQSTDYECLSPFAVLRALDELCKRDAEFEWLRAETEPGDYHDHEAFRRHLRTRLYDRIEVDLRTASGLVEQERYSELFDRYITNVGLWVKGEKIKNPVTGDDEDPDEKTMRDVEALLGVDADHEEHRRTLISKFAAWALDNPDETAKTDEVFPDHVERLQAAAFVKLRRRFAHLLRDLLVVLREAGSGLEGKRAEEARQMMERAESLGYCEHCAADAASSLLSERFRDEVG